MIHFILKIFNVENLPQADKA